MHVRKKARLQVFINKSLYTPLHLHDLRPGHAHSHAHAHTDSAVFVSTLRNLLRCARTSCIFSPPVPTAPILATLFAAAAAAAPLPGPWPFSCAFARLVAAEAAAAAIPPTVERERARERGHTA